MYLLVVEDDDAVRSFVVPRLEREGWEVHGVGTGVEALAAVADRRPDLVVLDIGLPDMSGLQVCRELRRQPDYLPVLMLTGLDAPADELAGFAAETDDYLTKPVQPDALVARIRALLRLATVTRDARMLRLGQVEVDLQLRTAKKNGEDLRLQPKEFDLLAFLLEHPRQVFGKHQLLSHVWGPDYGGDTHTVTVRMSRLRSLVEDNPNRPRHLCTRQGVGYYLDPDG